MRAKLLALAAALSALGGGAVYFLGWDSAEVTRLPESFGALEVVSREHCSTSACGSAQCDAARAILADAGSPCTLRYVECPVRLGAKARAQAADAGVAFSAARYQQVRLIALRCPADGGFALGIPVNADGWPQFATVAAPHPCAWKPTAGAACARVDGGDPGERNTMQPGEWAGAGCVRKACVEIAGTTSDPDGEP